MSGLFNFFIFLVLIPSVLFAQNAPADFVNPFIGTGGHGHTFPGATVPFGMVQLSPDTRIDGSWDGCSGYHYSDSVMYGFSHTHLSGTGVSDYGDFLIAPMSGAFSFDPKTYSSKFLHINESASAGYYNVLLDDDKIKVELTSTARVGFHKYIFTRGGMANLVLDLEHRDKLPKGEIKVVDNRTVNIYRQSEAWARDQRLYAVMMFSKPFADTSILQNRKAAFVFNMKSDEPLFVKVALSAVDYEGAMKNMKVEADTWDFEKIKSDARAAWNRELGKIEVKTDDKTRQTVFYTALYHCFIHPNIYSDVDGRYRGRDMRIHTAEGFSYYTVFSLWDTFRAWHPLMNIIDKKRSTDFIRTFLKQYELGGLLPVWELSSNETECMIGYHAAAAIADAVVTGNWNFDLLTALEAMKKSAESVQRFGLGAYMENGFLSVEDENESVSKTLEYAFDDWCIAQVAKVAERKEDYETYMHRSQCWKNIFDKSTRFMRPKQNGGWLSNFDPFRVDNNFTEANSWQYTFFVPHDISGLIEWMGGKENFEKKLDELFEASSKTTGREQADITGLIGQYAHGNEPSHHIAYLYNYIGKPWKTQEKVRQIMNDFYKNSPDGLIGNEDCGQMSAWYVMSAMGFYSVTPASGLYATSVPEFDEIKMHLENGNTFIIKTNNRNEKNKYISSATLRGQPYFNSYFHHNDILAGGEMVYELSDTINENFGTRYRCFPVAENTGKKIVPVPVIVSESMTFKNKMKVSLEAVQPEMKLYYMLSGPFEKPAKMFYENPFEIDTTTTVIAYAENEKGEASHHAKAVFYKMPHPDWKIKIFSEYNSQYTAGGDEGLIDGLRGDVNWRKGRWQGYQGQDFECTIDLGKITEVKKFSIGFLQDMRSWILMPLRVEFEISTDGKNFKNILTVENELDARDDKVQIKDFSGTIPKQKAQFVKVKAKNSGKLPEWHAGYPYNGEAFIFVDEIAIE